MPKVSVITLTKDRVAFLERALAGIGRQTYVGYEVIVVDDGSADSTQNTIERLSARGGSATGGKNLKIIRHATSLGITASRQEALEAAAGEYVAILDDDDEWVDENKLKKQAEFLDAHPEVALVGGGIEIAKFKNKKIQKFRPQSDSRIRRTMLLRNNFFTSTVMFRRAAALQAGGFLADGADVAEDYDLWLRLGRLGKFYNFQEVFTAYRQPSYNKERFKQFLAKQLRLIQKHRDDYPFAFIAKVILRIRILLKD